MIHVSTIEYDVELIDRLGTTYRLNEVISSLNWEEQKNEIAQRASITIHDVSTSNGKRMSEIAEINSKILIYGRWNIMEAKKADTSSESKSTRPTLKKGDKGEDGAYMQTELMKQGYPLPLYGADGYWLNETHQAVLDFQTAKGLSEVGICGNETWNALIGDRISSTDLKQLIQAIPPTRMLLFEGNIWDINYSDSNSKKDLSITAYDPIIRLQQSKDYIYYSPGMSTKEAVGKICAEWSIPLSYEWSQEITHEAIKFDSKKISDMIVELLEEVYKKTGEKYNIVYRDGTLVISDIGVNDTVYKFDESNTISSGNKVNINHLVTQVKIMGTSKDENLPVEDKKQGNIEFGVLQEIIKMDSKSSLEDMQAEATTILEERGKPEETFQISVPDVPHLRKGDKIEVSAGHVIGFFYVLGVSHNGDSRQMSLTIERFPLPKE